MRPFCLLLCLVLGVAMAAKDRNWETGKVLDANHSRYLAGMVGSSQTIGNAQIYGNSGSYNESTSGARHAIYRTTETILIEGTEYAYFAEEAHRSRWKKNALLTVNAPVKFAIEKRKLYVIDDEGKEHEMEITKRVLRLPLTDSRSK